MEASMWRLNQSMSLLSILPKSLNIFRREISNKLLFERLGLPEKPKKPLTPFLTFLSVEKSKVMQDNPNFSLKEAVKEASKRWQFVGKEEKEKLLKKFKEDFVKYKEKLVEYENSLTKEQKNEIKEAQKDLQILKQQKLVKLVKAKKAKELNKPKSPLGAFFKFLLRENRGQIPLKEFTKLMAEKWKQLPAAERSTLTNECQREFEKYKKDLLKWEEEMIKLGNLDMVRSSTLKSHLKTQQN